MQIFISEIQKKSNFKLHEDISHNIHIYLNDHINTVICNLLTQLTYLVDINKIYILVHISLRSSFFVNAKKVSNTTQIAKNFCNIM